MISPELLELKAKNDFIIQKYEEFIKSQTPHSEVARSTAMYRKTMDVKSIVLGQKGVVNNTLRPIDKTSLKDFGLSDLQIERVNKAIKDAGLGDTVGAVPAKFFRDREVDPASNANNEENSADNPDSSSGKNNNWKDDFMGQLWKDCIPCWDRAKWKVDDFKLIFKNLLNQFIDTLCNIIKGPINLLTSLLSNNDVFNDICTLFSFLEFQCVPDLAAIISMLTFLLFSLKDKLTIGLGTLLFGLVAALLSPIFFGISSYFNQLVGMLLAPIDCILTSLQLQASKIPGSIFATPEVARNKAQAFTEELKKDAANRPDESNVLFVSNTPSYSPGDFKNPTLADIKQRRMDKYRQKLNEINGIKTSQLQQQDEIINGQGFTNYSKREQLRDDNINKINKDLGDTFSGSDTERVQREFTSEIENDPSENNETIGDFLASLTMGLDVLHEMVTWSKNVMVGYVARIETQLNEFTGSTLADFEVSYKSVSGMQKISRMIALINLMIILSKDFSDIKEKCKSGEFQNELGSEFEQKVRKFFDKVNTTTENLLGKRLPCIKDLGDPLNQFNSSRDGSDVFRDQNTSGEITIPANENTSDEIQGPKDKNIFVVAPQENAKIADSYANRRAINNGIDDLETIHERTGNKPENNQKSDTSRGVSIQLETATGFKINATLIKAGKSPCLQKSNNDAAIIKQMMAELQGFT